MNTAKVKLAEINPVYVAADEIFAKHRGSYRKMNLVFKRPLGLLDKINLNKIGSCGCGLMGEQIRK